MVKKSERLAAGTRARAHRRNIGFTKTEDSKRKIANGKIVITMGKITDSTYQVKFNESGWVDAWTYACFDRNELDVIPERVADFSDFELEAQFLEAEKNALAWANYGNLSGQHCATRWMEFAAEIRAEISRRGR